MTEAGTLYLCATPIGNLEDITPRVLRTLSEADIIAAEDTRHTLQLLNHFNIKGHLVRYDEHSKDSARLLLRGCRHHRSFSEVFCPRAKRTEQSSWRHGRTFLRQ